MQRKIVTVLYKVYEVDSGGGEKPVPDEMQDDGPADFVTGDEYTVFTNLINTLANLAPGDEFSVDLPPEDAFGERREDCIAEVDFKKIRAKGGRFDKSAFRPGAVVPVEDSEGNVANPVVLSVSDKSVTLDFNHPLAGKTLRLKGVVTDSKPANRKNMAEFLRRRALRYGEDDAGGFEGCGGCRGSCRGGCEEGGACHAGGDRCACRGFDGFEA